MASQSHSPGSYASITCEKQGEDADGNVEAIQNVEENQRSDISSNHPEHFPLRTDSDDLLSTPNNTPGVPLHLQSSSQNDTTNTTRENNPQLASSVSNLEMDFFISETEALSPLLLAGTRCKRREDEKSSSGSNASKNVHSSNARKDPSKEKIISRESYDSNSHLSSREERQISFKANDEERQTSGRQAGISSQTSRQTSSPSSPQTRPSDQQRHISGQTWASEANTQNFLRDDASIRSSRSNSHSSDPGRQINMLELSIDDHEAMISTTARPTSPSVTSSDSSQGLSSLRRYVQARAATRRSTLGSASSQATHNNVQSLGEEDWFAMSINGEDPRLPLHNSYSGFGEHQGVRMHTSETFPPVVWEEPDAEPETVETNRRRRTMSESDGMRLRSFLRRRGDRQSSSVRRHLPRSSSSNNAPTGVASPLSTTAAAVLFTSSQASIDSASGHPLPSPLSVSHRARQPVPGFNNRHSRLEAHSTSTLDDSARAVGTLDRSVLVDGAAGDSLSISTIGNSTNLTGIGDSSRGRASGATREPHQYQQDVNINNRGQRDNDNRDDIDRDREARVRWVRINQRFQLMITFVAIVFSLFLFSILITWIVLTSSYVISFEKTCDVPLKLFYWMATLNIALDIFRNDIMRHILRWDPNRRTGTTHHTIPARVVAYNIAYLAYACLVLRMGINCVFIDGQHEESTCRDTSPELFKSSVAFVTLALAAWATIILGYVVPFCFVAILLTMNGYNPGDSVNEARVAAGNIPGGVFPNAYSQTGAPPGCIDLLREVDLNECSDNAPQECCICMEDFRTGRHHANDIIIQTDCGHILHKNCCSVWLRQARTCPVCRTDIPNAQDERLRQEEGQPVVVPNDPSESTERLEEAGRHQQHHRAQRVHLNSPHIPFRPGGRHEVETLIRAFRNQGQRGGNDGNRHRNRLTGSDDNRSERARNRTGSNRSESSNNNQSVESRGGIEILPLDHRSLTSRRSQESHTQVSNRNDEETQLVL